MRAQRPHALTIVLGTIALAVGLLATPAATVSGSPGPTSAVDFVGAWTNDDGGVDGADLGDDGVPSPGYDAWLLSSSDPSDPGIDPLRYDKDVAICTAEVRGDDPDYVDVTIENAYPGYHCTFTTILENGASVPVEIAPTVIDTDPGLLVEALDPQFPGQLAGGDRAAATFAVTVLQEAPQNETLHFTITIQVATPPCEGPIVFGVERGTGDLYAIDPVAGTAWLLADITDPAPANINSPNGLAYDAGNGRLYFSVNDTQGDAVATSELWFWDGTIAVYAGDVTGLPAGAAFADGAYFYFVNATDELRSITFNPDGTIAADTLFAANVTGNTVSLRFGDIVITGDTMYGSTNAPPENFFSITGLGGTNTYTEISAPQGSRLQLAFGDDGTLFGQSTPTGEFFTVDPLTGATSSLGIPTGATDGMTDLASGVCPDDWPPGPSGPILYGVEEGSGDLFSIDIGAGEVEQIADLPPLASIRDGLAYDPATDRLYFAYSDGGPTSDLWFWDGSNVTLAGEIPGEVTHATFRDGQYLYLPSPNVDRGEARIAFDTYRAPDRELAIVPGGGGEVLILEDGDFIYERAPAWTPDGATLVFVHYGLGTGPYTIQAKPSVGGTRTAWTTYGTDHQPDVSPDGTMVAFHSSRAAPPRSDAYVMPAGGGVATKIADDAIDPKWSPDGSRIAFVRTDGTQVCTMDPDGSDVECLTSGEGPDWSPDGTQLVFHRPVSGAKELFVINADGTGETQLTFIGGVSEFASWSPDGSLIAFQRYDSGEIWVIEPDGTDATALAMYVDQGGGSHLTIYGSNPAFEPQYQPLMAVGFDGAGMVDSVVTVLASLGTFDTFRNGDIVVDPAGTMLHGSTTQSGDTPPMFYSVDLGTGAFTTISTSDALGLQLAFGDDGLLYGHDTSTGEFFIVDPATGATTSLGVPSGLGSGFVDLAGAG